MFVRILRLAKPFWPTLGIIAITILITSGLRQVDPLIARSLTDAIIGGDGTGKTAFIIRLLGLVLLTRLGIRILNRVSWYLTHVHTARLKAHLREVGFGHLTSLSIGFFHKHISGKMMSQLDRGVNRISDVVSNSGMHFVPNVITAIISVVIVMRINWKLGLMALLSFIPYSMINYWRFKKNASLEKKEHKLYDVQYAHFWEAVSSIELIKSFRAENFELRRLKAFNRKIVNLRRTMEKNTNKALIGDVILEAWMWGLYAYIVWIAYVGSITVGTMVLLVGYINLIREPLWNLNWIFWEVKRAQIGAREYFEILDVEPAITDPDKPTSLENAKGRITFEHVSFSYPDGAGVLKDVSFTIKPGETVALVGPSGSGKTTLATLMIRLFDVDSGRILLDGIDLRQLMRSDIRNNIGVVSQDAVLFADTIEENLRYGKPNATRKEMERATRLANAHEFIVNLSKGFNTEIGERGVMLSGGQKQRLSLARTILKNPPIIIMDEATSSLDSHSELLIQESLERVLKGRTAVIIAHRLSTISNADKIIVLKDQGILEQGTHRELLKKKGLYASLFKVQSGQISTLRDWDLVE